ncbi:hypothetical protein FRAHR75_330018 [Frankia sp. Hr75.2]|nr:hypothetical protein FRAHR75_330018 [Frankia sp. Hr75.2]
MDVPWSVRSRRCGRPGNPDLPAGGERTICHRRIEDNPPVAVTLVEVVGKRRSAQRLGVLT